MWQDRVELACSTLNYRAFPFQRALEGIRRSGYDFLSFGTTHEDVHIPNCQMTDGEIAELARQIADHGLQARSGILGHDVRVDAQGGADACLRELDQFLALGCRRLVAAGPWYYAKWPNELKSPEQWQSECDAFYAAMDKVLPRAEQLGMIVCLKPHTGLCAHSGRVREVLARLPSPALGVCWDAGNVSFYEGVCPDLGLDKIVPWVKCVCLKDHKGRRANPVFPPLGEGNVDHDEYFGVLAAGGFEGLIMIERLGLREGEPALTAEQTDDRGARTREVLLPLLERHFA